MNRRAFLAQTTTALAAGATASLWAASSGPTAASGAMKPPAFFNRFPACTDFEAVVPIVRIATNRIIHRFFDTSPISPSGRYVALFRLPNEVRTPQPGESGDVVLVDLETAQERVVAQSRGWETQMGANVQWGATDADLFFNDVDPATWTPFAVQLNPVTGAKRRIECTVFTVSPDGKFLTSYNLITSRRIQVGYGVVLPEDRTPRNVGPVATDGLYLTEIATGRTRMIASIKDIYERAVPSIAVEHPQRFEYYLFQIRWNPQGTRVMAFLRWADPAKASPVRLLTLVTMKPDGTDIRVAVTPKQYARGGHHPMWTPDGEHITLNLRIRDGDTAGLDIVQVRYDGADLHSIFPVGSGHPSMHPTRPFLITDAYHTEPVTRGDGTAPLRLIDLRSKRETVIAQVRARRSDSGKLTSEFRIDGHPVWDKSGRYVVFNGVHNDTRSVFIADLGAWLEKAAAGG
ncbi:hypothetical protein [Horticoccus sp. 23ND18S-11]|uniref:hypothetical protein n=1 Tax=Horticoccus sp. 23ND18S-11 TaxID=3391832 RepID=UPI0039C95640